MVLKVLIDIFGRVFQKTCGTSLGSQQLFAVFKAKDVIACANISLRTGAESGFERAGDVRPPRKQANLGIRNPVASLHVAPCAGFLGYRQQCRLPAMLGGNGVRRSSGTDWDLRRAKGIMASGA